MTPRRLLALAAFAALIPPAFAASPFDGQWQGTAEGSGRNCPSGRVQFSIIDGDALGHASLGEGGGTIRGHVEADGSFHGTLALAARTAAITGSLAGDAFTGSWAYGSCLVKATLSRAK